MNDLRHGLTLAALAASTLAAAMIGPSHGSPDPVIMFAVLFASLTAGLTGFAFSPLCGAILVHQFDDPARLVQLLLVCSFANQLLTIWTLRRDIAARSLLPLLTGGAAGIAPGLWALLHLDREPIVAGTGIFYFLYALAMLFGRRGTLRAASPWSDATVGFAASASGAITGLSSLPVVLWCRAHGQGKDAQRATALPFGFMMQVLTLPLLTGFAGGPGASLADLFCVPAGLFGTAIGIGCMRALSERQFARTVGALLLVCGVSFLL